MAIRVLAIGAHPDDCELKVGGCAAMWAANGDVIRFLSMTNGDTGHFAMGGGPLARRRRDEAAAAAALIGIESQMLDNHNGELMPTLEARKSLIHIIREFLPDLILTHRPYDYHPDHRYTSQLVQDSSYQLGVPNMMALSARMEKRPVIMYFSDNFQKPAPFTPDIAVDISAVIDKKVAIVACPESQVFEWLPFDGNRLHEVPSDPDERLRWLSERQKERSRKDADGCRALLIATYGEQGQSIEYAESFETCEYGASLTDTLRCRLFPFLPKIPIYGG